MMDIPAAQSVPNAAAALGDQGKLGGPETVFTSESFLPRHYLSEYHTIWDDEDQFMASVLTKFCSQIPPQETMIDVGSGPTIYQVISARRVARQITMSDYLAVNRDEIQMWMDADKDAFDWDRTFKAYAELEGKVATPEVLAQMKAELRASFKKVVRCDVRKRQTFDAETQGLYDIVSSHYVAESITNKETIFVRSLRNVINLAKKNGYLLLSFLCESNHYQVGDTAFSAFNFKIKDLIQFLEDLNLEILDRDTLYCQAAILHEHGPLLSLLARKRQARR